MPASAHTNFISADCVVEAIRDKRFHNGSAPGFSGWTADLLVTVSDDTDCAAALALIVTDIANGRIAQSVRNRLFVSVLIALAKEPLPRPIAMGEALYKLTASLLTSTVLRRHSRTLFPRVQYGLGVNGGVEAAVHATQAALSSSSSLCTLKLDFSNAFNARSRSDIARALYSRPETASLWRLFQASYGAPTPLLYFDSERQLIARLSSQQGVRQGDPLGSFAFALSMQELYEAVADVSGVVVAVAVHDDLTVTGPIGALTEVFALVSRHCTAASGLSLNPPKCKLLPGALSPTPTVRKFCVETKVGLCDRFMPLLGAVVYSSHGVDPNVTQHPATQHVLESAKASHDPFFSVICHPKLPAQTRLILLRACGVPRLNYLARTVQPDMLAPTARYFDTLVSGALAHLLTGRVDISALSQRALIQASLPVRMGGLALRPYVLVSPAAYLSALALSLPLIPAALHSSLGRVIDRTASALRALHCERLIPPPPERAGQPAAPAPADPVGLTSSHFLRLFAPRASCPKHLQRFYSAQIEEHRRAVITEQAPVHHRARLTALLNPGAMLWVRLMPSEPLYRLTDSEVGHVLRLTLGMHPRSATPLLCSGCNRDATREPLPFDHLLCCRHARSLSCSARHREVARVLAYTTRELGATCELEYRSYARRATRLRPDARITGLDGVDFLTDVMVTTPSAPSHAVAAAATPLATASKGDAVKSRKYADFSASEHVPFHPFVLEAYGALGIGAQRVLSLIAQHATANRLSSPIAAHSFSPWHWLAAAISFAVQRGNARGLEAAARRGSSYYLRSQ
jgi:hypothetical protein